MEIVSGGAAVFAVLLYFVLSVTAIAVAFFREHPYRWPIFIIASFVPFGGAIGLAWACAPLIGSRIQCPQCKEAIQAGALVCPHCRVPIRWSRDNSQVYGVAGVHAPAKEETDSFLDTLR